MKALVSGIGLILVGVITWWLTVGCDRWDWCPGRNGPQSEVVSLPVVQPPTRMIMSPDEVGFDRPDSDLQNYTTQDFAGCKTACLADKACVAVAFRISSSQCWLKKDDPANILVRKENSDFISSVKRPASQAM